MENPFQNSSTVRSKAHLTNTMRDQLLAYISECIENGETFITEAHFDQALARGYEFLANDSLPDELKPKLAEMVKEVNEKSPEVFLIPGIENWVTATFVTTVRQNKWGVVEVQEKGPQGLRELLRQDKVKALLGHLQVPPSKINLRKCLSASLDEIVGRKTVKPKRADRLQQASLADQGKTGQALQGGQRRYVLAEEELPPPVGEPSPEEVEQRTAEQKRIQTELRKDQLQHLLDHADSYVKQGKLSAEEAEKLLQFNKVEEAERKGSISEEKGERIRNSIMDRTVRYELDRKVREATDYAVSYIQVFESMKKINPKYDQALQFLIEHKEFVNADKNQGLDPTPIIENLIGNLDCLKQLIDLMDRQDAETRMMFARMPPYSYVVKRGQDLVKNLVIEEGFVESLRQVERDEMISRLNAEDRQLRVRPAADMLCLYSLLQRVVKATPIRREIRILKINMIVEEFYRSIDDLEEARGKALEFLNSRLRGLYPDLSAEETSAINERSAEIIDRVEKKILAERGSQQEAVAEKENESQDDALSAEEEGQGAQIGRVALRVAGKRRLMSYKIMPDSEEDGAFVLAQRHPKSGALIPVKRGGVKHQVRQGSDGVWELS